MIIKLNITICFLLALLSIDMFGNQSYVDSLENCIPTIDSLDGKQVTINPEKPPVYPGGMTEFYNFLLKNINHSIYQDDLQTKVLLTFIIDTSGYVRNSCIYKPYNKNTLSLLEKEVLRIISTLPQWMPGEIAGDKVPVRIKIPIIIDRY